MSRRAVAVVVVAALAIAGVVAGFGLRGGRAEERLPARSTTTTSTAPPKAVGEVVADVERFVADTRGLAFKHEVPVRLLDQAQFKARLLADANDDRADTAIAERVLRAVGLIDAGVDLHRVLEGFLGDAVVGFYDTKRHDLVLRGAALTPYARATLAHELTHALDDQWFGLERPALDRPGADEAGLAFQALTEGNAVRVEDAYRRAMSPSERLQADLEEQRLSTAVDMTGVPPVVPELVGFPYVEGPKFVRALLVAGGERRVDDAFRTPPVTSEEIVHPQAWLAGRRPVPVGLPAAGPGKVIDKGVYGYSSLLVTLEPIVGIVAATRAARGWAGDGFVAWDAAGGSGGGARTCVRARFVMATPGDLDQLTTSLRSWAAPRQADIERQPSSVAFTSCG